MSICMRGALALLAVVVSACGGAAAANSSCQAPVALAGPGLSLSRGASVQLHGSTQQSTGTVSYSWQLIAVPPGSTTTLSSADVAAPTFSGDVQGVYVASLIVRDSCAASAPVTTVVTIGNHVPQAVPGPDQRVSPGDTVTLTGSGTDADGDALTFQWKLISHPDNSGAVLSSTTAPSPSFVADRGGTYVALLTVSDGAAVSASAEVVVQAVAVSTANHRPVAVVGSKQQVLPGDTVVLDGSASSDLDHDLLTWQWSFISTPGGSAASLVGADTPTPHFVPDVFGNWIIALTVSDGQAFSEPVEMIVQSGVTDPAGTCAPAAPPVANAGPDLVTTFFAQPDGSRSTTGRPFPLAWHWTIASKPAGSTASLSPPNVSQPFLSLDKVGDYMLSLVVNDGCVDSAPATMHITRSNNPPSIFVFSFFQSQPILVPFTVATSAFDSDGDPLTFSWQVVSKPPGSSATFDDATAQQPSFTPDLPGNYTLSVVASDSLSSSLPATVTISAVNQPPSAAVGPDQAVTGGATIALDGSPSTDPSHRTLTFAWTLTAPPGSTAALSDATAAKPTFVADVSGVYMARLVVTAGGLSSNPAVVTVSNWPAVSRLSHRVIDAAWSKSLDRMVMVAADPSALYIFDPHGSPEIVVPLSLPPSSVSLSGDGHFAAVGHLNAISYVDLQAAAVVQALPVSADVAQVTLADNGFVYAFARSTGSDHAHILSVPLAGGTEPVVSSTLIGPLNARLRRSNGALYVTGTNFTNMEEYTVIHGLASLVVPSADPNVNSCGELWLSQDESRLISRCGQIFHSSASTDDLSLAGSVARGGPSIVLHQLDDSTAAGEMSAVTSQDQPFFFFSADDDRTVRRWSADGLSAKETLLFPSLAVGTSSFAWSGRFVFYRSDGSERYIVMQLDPAAAASQDFGVVTF
jgi:hypothetical protein